MTEEVKSGVPSDWHQIGGNPTVRDLVDRIFRRILTESFDFALPPEQHLIPVFGRAAWQRGRGWTTEQVIDHNKPHLVHLFTEILGGPKFYIGRDLAEAHAGLGITDPQFRRICALIVEEANALGVPDEIIARIGERLAKARAQIVTS